MALSKNITESGIVYTGDGQVKNVVINSHTNGTLSLIDGTEASTAASGTLTSSGACAPATHASATLTSTGASVPATHAVTVFTATANFQEGVKASGVLTSDQTQPTAGQAVVLGATTYTFVALGSAATYGATACNVPLGNTTAETMRNLYNAMLRNAEADVVLTSTYVITATAKAVGTAGNSIAATETSTHLDWDGSNTTLTGGVAADTITIGTTVYTPKTIPSAPYHFAIKSTLALSLASLVDAIQGENSYAGTVAHTQVVVAASDATTITLRGRVPGVSLNSVATTETCANASFPDTTLGGGTGASDAGVTTANATVTIGSTVYTIVDELSENYGAAPIAYQVKKGASEATMLDNLKLAINGTGTAGTNYSTGTVAHPSVVATTNTDTTQIIRGRVPGVSLNDIATTETLANTAFGGTTLGGAGNTAGVTTAAATITIGTRVYTAVKELSETLGASAIADQILWVTSEAVFLDNVKKAVNETGIAGTDYSTGTKVNADVLATTNSATQQVFVSRLLGVAQNAIATVTTLANYAFGAATLASGTGATGKLLVNTITFSAVATTGERYIELGDLDFTRGLYATIGGTADLTLSYDI